MKLTSKLFVVMLLLTVFSPLAVSSPTSPSRGLVITSIVSAQALVSNSTQTAQLQQISMNLQSYSPARILITYAYTSSFNISKVSAVGMSLYRIVSGPTSVDFQAVDIDSYHFSVVISYQNIMVEQNIQISTWSGSQSPQGTIFSVRANIIRFDFTLTVSKEPKYPSVDEVAIAVVNQLSNSLQQFQVKQDAFVAKISDTILSIGMIAAVAFVLVIVLLITVVGIHRKVAALEEHGVR